MASPTKAICSLLKQYEDKLIPLDKPYKPTSSEITSIKLKDHFDVYNQQNLLETASAYYKDFRAFFLLIGKTKAETVSYLDCCASLRNTFVYGEQDKGKDEIIDPSNKLKLIAGAVYRLVLTNTEAQFLYFCSISDFLPGPRKNDPKWIENKDNILHFLFSHDPNKSTLQKDFQFVLGYNYCNSTWFSRHKLDKKLGIYWFESITQNCKADSNQNYIWVNMAFKELNTFYKENLGKLEKNTTKYNQLEDKMVKNFTRLYEYLKESIRWLSIETDSLIKESLSIAKTNPKAKVTEDGKGGKLYLIPLNLGQDPFDQQSDSENKKQLKIIQNQKMLSERKRDFSAIAYSLGYKILMTPRFSSQHELGTKYLRESVEAYPDSPAKELLKNSIQKSK